MRVTVGTIVGLLAEGNSAEDIQKAYPYLETEDIKEALEYAAWRSSEYEIELHTGMKQEKTVPRISKYSIMPVQISMLL